MTPLFMSDDEYLILDEIARARDITVGELLNEFVSPIAGRVVVERHPGFTSAFFEIDRR